jgi:hypothetical protein
VLFCSRRLTRNHLLMLARRLFETNDLDEARGIASELQRLVREHVEELGLKHYWREIRAAGQSHAAKIVKMPRKTKF